MSGKNVPQMSGKMYPRCQVKMEKGCPFTIIGFRNIYFYL